MTDVRAVSVRGGQPAVRAGLHLLPAAPGASLLRLPPAAQRAVTAATRRRPGPASLLPAVRNYILLLLL